MTIETFGLVLAGGLARRMGGGDKAFIRIGGATILERALAALAPQGVAVIVNANGATASDVRSLMALVQREVIKQFNVKLVPEVELVGEW